MESSRSRVTNLRDHQIRSYRQLLPAIGLFSTVDGLLLAVYFGTVVDPAPLWLWAGALALNSAAWAWMPTDWFSRRGWPTAQAASEGVLFGGFLALLFPSLSGGQDVVLAAFSTGLMAAGTLVKAPLPGAAAVFVVLMTGALEAGVLRSTIPNPWPVAVLAAAFGAAMLVLTRQQFVQFAARHEAEENLERQKTLTTHLLMDFSESASEGLWESDPQGRLTMVSPRLVQVFGQAETHLLGRPLGTADDWARILQPGTAFRARELSVEVAGERRWWSVSGKPLRDAAGQVTGWRGVGSDVTARRSEELERIRRSRLDGLTGLLNRDAFRSLLDDITANPDDSHPWSLVLLDVMDFRDVNEGRGHAAGDQLLQEIARRLALQAAPGTVLARLDGDEFALLSEVDGNDPAVRIRGRNLWQRLTEPYVLEDTVLSVGFHGGTTQYPADARGSEEWLRCTDLALRTAKTKGPSGVVRFRPEFLEQYRRRIALRDDLRRAIADGSVTVAYQPQVRLSDGATVGFEALARWTHPDRGPIPPLEFIGLAEESFLMADLGLQILRRSAREAAGWPEPWRLSVNITASQLASGNLPDQVDDVLAETGLVPGRLVLEVTESAFLADSAAIRASLDRLKAAGVSLALDDFGTGYSALAYLQKFPFDKLKIDRSFVEAATGPGGSPAVLTALVDLARALGMETVAEGIETRQQADLLIGLGCDEGQGWLYGRPGPVQIPASRAQ